MESKYTHLLQPIRDLAENWNINLAGDLEEYMEELDKMCFSFDNENAKTFNFAEGLV